MGSGCSVATNSINDSMLAVLGFTGRHNSSSQEVMHMDVSLGLTSTVSATLTGTRPYTAVQVVRRNHITNDGLASAAASLSPLVSIQARTSASGLWGLFKTPINSL